LIAHIEEEHRPRVLENKVFRKVFGPKRDEVARDWRRLRNEELYDLYCRPDIKYSDNLIRKN
jgi:hypothetical protein